MSLSIRKAVANDAPQIAEFNNLLAEESEGKSLDPKTIEDGVAAMLADSNKGSYFLAEEAGQVVGQIGITFEWSDWRNGWFWWIQSVYIRIEARRQGVFSALYRHVEDMARREPSVIGLRLYVEEENKSAQETYYKLGMSKTGYFLLEKYPLEKSSIPTLPKLWIGTQPTVIVIGGSNGAGKTTASRTLLADALQVMSFVNADIIAQGLGGFDTESVALEAGRIMLLRLRELAAKRQDFAFETTLAARTYAPWLRELKDAGYAVHLVYFWLGSPELAIARVAERVRRGGHNIPEATIRQRYQRSLEYFFNLYRPIADSWRVYTNLRAGVCQPISFGNDTGDEVVVEKVLWETMQKQLKQ